MIIISLGLWDILGGNEDKRGISAFLWGHLFSFALACSLLLLWALHILLLFTSARFFFVF